MQSISHKIMVCKDDIVTQIWSFYENLENYRKLILLWKDCILAVDMSNKNENNFCIVSGPGIC